MIADLVAKLDALRANAEQKQICPEYAYQAIRHINRNCDMSCALDHEDGSECVEWGRYDGPAVATLWNNWPRLRAIVVAAQAYVDALDLMYGRQMGGPTGMERTKQYNKAQAALVAAVRGEA